MKAAGIACDVAPDGNAASAASHAGAADAWLSGPGGERTCIVVLGMHRSGTSALTRVLSLLGAALPKNLLGAAPSNATGHWEPENLIVFHDTLLAGLQSAWDDWTALGVSQLTAQRLDEVRTRIAEIIDDDYGSAPLMVIKDPRICRFAPLFLDALTQAGITPACVLTFRNPLEVAQSLERRNGMLRGDAGLLWLRHVLDAENATRGRQRAILFYDDLLADWRSEVRRIPLGAEPDAGMQGAPEETMGAEAGPGRVWPHPAEEVCEQIDVFLSAGQRHHAHSAADLMDDPVMSGWIADAYDALHQLRQHPPPDAAFATLDRVRAEFDRATPLLGRMQSDLRARLEAENAAEAELHAAELHAAVQAAALAPTLVTACAAVVERPSDATRRDGDHAGQQPFDSVAPIAGATQQLEELPRCLSHASGHGLQCLMAVLRKARTALRKTARSG